MVNDVLIIYAKTWISHTEHGIIRERIKLTPNQTRKHRRCSNQRLRYSALWI